MINISDIVIGTGNYENIKSGNTVSITGDGGNAWGYFGASYKKLAPRLKTYISYIEGLEKLKKINIEEYLKIKKEIEDEYIRSYYLTRLKDLDIEELFKNFEKKYGTRIILLCHEPIDEFCHRRIFADYVELKTGIYIPEILIGEDKKIKKIEPIRYKNRIKKIMEDES